MEVLHEINENSTYDEAFEVSVKMIKLAYKLYVDKTKTTYEDFKQECALYFYDKLKNKYSPLDACNITTVAYKWIAYNLRKKKSLNLGKEYDVTEWQIEDKHSPIYFPVNDFGMKDIDFEICKLLISGYSLSEVAGFVGLTPQTTQQHLTDIKRILMEIFIRRLKNG